MNERRAMPTRASMVVAATALTVLGCGDSFEASPAPGDATPPSTPAPSSIPPCRTDVEPHRQQMRVPGLSVGIVKDGALWCVATAGMADLEQGREVTPDTLFAWASVSKTVTATAAMVLYDEGRLDLDRDVADYLPFAVANPHCPSAPITVRQLLTHTSSIVDAASYDDLYTIGDPELSLGGYLHDYLVAGGTYYDPETNFDGGCPGTHFEYSNVAVALLGHVVESVAGVPFDDFCRARIFEPLGMDAASFYLANLDEARVAMPYGRTGPDDFVPLGHQGLPTVPDGALRTTVPQLARLLVMMTEQGTFGGERILASATVDLVRQVQHPALEATQGLIWFYAYGGLLGHDGSDPGTSAYMFYDPVDGSGALMAANGDWYDTLGDAAAADELLIALIEEARR